MKEFQNRGYLKEYKCHWVVSTSSLSLKGKSVVNYRRQEQMNKQIIVFIFIDKQASKQ